ncbi:MAG: serine protease [Verrucomicrobia bacterium]|nr:serine protease [Verrucomicrobiota bacterium]
MKSLRISLSLCLLAALPVMAGNFNTIDQVRPRIGQRGTTVEVTISGDYLRGAEEIAFYRPGIRVLSIEPQGKPPENPLKWRPALKCKFEIAPDCPVGEHVFRVRTPWTLSMAATFNVTPLPVVDEVEGAKERGTKDNDSVASAMPVESGVSVYGLMDGRASGDRDVFRVPVKPGGRFTAEVDCVRISDFTHGHGEDSGFDLKMRVLDAAGKELAANDDNALHVQDPLVSFRVPETLPSPADGTPGSFVFVEVQRSTFTSYQAPYALHLGDFPRPLAAFPPGGPAGETVPVRWLGDPLGGFTSPVAMPRETGTFRHAGQSPTTMLLRSSAMPNVLEAAGEGGTRVDSLPAALNGIIGKADEVDRFRVLMKKGARYRVRVFAAALGSPLQPKLQIQAPAADGKPADPALVKFTAEKDERDVFGISAYGGGVLPEAIDPSVIWEAKTDGEHLISMADLGGGGSPLSVYRIEVEPTRDAIFTVLPNTLYWWEAPKWASLGIPRGDRWTVNLNLMPCQGNTFKGETEIVAEGLPKGVRLLPNRVPAGAGKWPIQFEADADATLASAVIALKVRPLDPAVQLESGSQQNLPFLNKPGGDAWKTVRLDRFMLAVLEKSPFSLEVAEPAAAIVRGGELAIPVRLIRRDGFNEQVGFQCDWKPAGIGGPPQLVFEPGQTESVLSLSADLSAPLGPVPLVVTANTKERGDQGWHGDGQIRVSSRILKLVVAEPFVELASQPDSVRRGERKKMTWTVKHKTPFSGAAPVRLVGLPKGVELHEPLPLITSGTKEIAFDIEATDDALIGTSNGLTCELAVSQAGQVIRQRSGRGILRTDPRP